MAPITSHKYKTAREKEERILNIISEHPEGLSPSILSGIIHNIKYKTIKSILRRLEQKGIVKNMDGYYSIVQNNTHALFSFNFQNIVMQVETPEIIVANRICESSSLDEIIKFRMEIGAGGGMATMSVSTDYPFNATTLTILAHIFQEKLLRLCNFKPELDEIKIITQEANRDYFGYRIEKNCWTVRNAIADFKLYNKKEKNCVREEYKIITPLPVTFMSDLLQQGITTGYYSKKIDNMDIEIEKLNKTMINIKDLIKRFLDKIK